MLRALASLTLVLVIAASAAAEMLQTDHVSVEYDKSQLEEAYPRAFARVTEAALKSAVSRFGFTDVPDDITLRISVDPAQKLRLFTNGRDTFTLQLAGRNQLAPPDWSGVYNLYGMCHELGHIVMFRPIENRDWLTGEASEGWAHYFGSVVTDDVYAAEGEAVWPEPYDYRADGTRRLKKQLSRAPLLSRITGPDQTLAAAGLWLELAEIIGEKKLPALFAAWGSARMDPVNPSPAIRAALETVSADARLDAWFAKAEGVMWKKRPASPLAAAATAPVKAPAGKPVELAVDDGKSAGQRSLGGSGHAVAFETPDGGDGYILTAVKVFGARYGAPQPPKEDFQVFLCDMEGKVIRNFPFPYRTFLKGDARWVTLKCEPTPLPPQFLIAVSFNPGPTKGVYVHFDAASDGDSRTGLPPDFNEAFAKGDWMIRVLVAEKKGD